MAAPVPRNGWRCAKRRARREGGAADIVGGGSMPTTEATRAAAAVDGRGKPGDRAGGVAGAASRDRIPSSNRRRSAFK
eukprot:6721121-Prymnesium_polylepis.1